MRFVLARGNFGDDLARFRIDHIDRLRKLGAHVEIAVRTKFRIVRTQRLAEVDRIGQFAVRDIDDVDGAAVRTRLAHAGVSIDRDVGKFAVRADRDFMPVDADGDFGDFLARVGIDDQRGVLELVGDHEQTFR